MPVVPTQDLPQLETTEGQNMITNARLYAHIEPAAGPDAITVYLAVTGPDGHQHAFSSIVTLGSGVHTEPSRATNITAPLGRLMQRVVKDALARLGPDGAPTL